MKLPLILDGATGTELIKRGMPSGACPEGWILEHPDVIATLQREYADAGSNIVLAPTFGAIRAKLEAGGVNGDVTEINKKLTEISRSAVPSSVAVAADVSPTGFFIAPFGDETMKGLISIYSEQMSAFELCDVVISETNMTISDARAAILAAKRTLKKPIFVTFTCNPEGRTMTGASVAAALVICKSLGASAFGLNCGSGPEEMLEVLKNVAPYAGSLPLIAKPNAGLPDISGGETHYHMTPEDMAAYVAPFFDAGVRIFGGCCGTTPAHIRAISDALSTLDTKKTLPETVEYLATERELVPVSDAQFSEEIVCSEFLSDDLYDCVDVCPTIRISQEEDIAILEENQHAAALPICIACDDDTLLESALISYNGRAAVKSCAGRAKELCSYYGAYILD